MAIAQASRSWPATPPSTGCGVCRGHRLARRRPADVARMPMPGIASSQAGVSEKMP